MPEKQYAICVSVDLTTSLGVVTYAWYVRGHKIGFRWSVQTSSSFIVGVLMTYNDILLYKVLPVNV